MANQSISPLTRSEYTAGGLYTLRGNPLTLRVNTAGCRRMQGSTKLSFAKKHLKRKEICAARGFLVSSHIWEKSYLRIKLCI